MPELPEVVLYLEALERTIAGRMLERVRLRSPSLLRTWGPPLAAAHGRRVIGLSRAGKRIVWELDGELYLVFHLMVTGRFHLRKAGAALPGKGGHAAFDFSDLTLLLTEMGTKKKASLHLVLGEHAVADLDPGGIEPLDADPAEFQEALVREDRTLKRALTDPRILSGIGNTHSDEILHRAGLSPVRRTSQLSADEMERLHHATVAHLEAWTDRLRREGSAFPRRSARSTPTTQCTASAASPARPAAAWSNASATPTVRPTTVPAARLGAACWRIGPYLACSARTFPARSKSSKGSRTLAERDSISRLPESLVYVFLVLHYCGMADRAP